MVLAFTSNSQSSGLDPRKDDSNKFAERCRVEWHYSFCTTASSILRVDAIPRDGCLCRFANCAKPRKKPLEINHTKTAHFQDGLSSPEHGEKLLGLLSHGCPLLLDDLLCNLSQRPTLIPNKHLAQFLVVGGSDSRTFPPLIVRNVGNQSRRYRADSCMLCK